MPIAGVVISVQPEEIQAATREISQIAGVEVQGHDDQGHIVAVLETASLKAMEKLVDGLNALPAVLNVGLSYINTEEDGADTSPPDIPFKGARRT